MECEGGAKMAAPLSRERGGAEGVGQCKQPPQQRASNYSADGSHLAHS